ncbi:DNA polymerase III subunit delta [Melioribacter sp. OK-6-Me]|uniref:DNA polymerase III subunit delta n=1 Tax=unclassified Melioribacter TaxID=2627329 RepID=UPI003EDB13BB
MAIKSVKSVNQIIQEIKKGIFKPVYYLCGNDQYSLESAVDYLQKQLAPQINSEFDKEIIAAEKGEDINRIIDLALAFPFGGGKKLLIIKNFENINNKKELVNYLDNPPDFTVLVILQYAEKTELNKEPFKLLNEKGYLYEAMEESGEDLVNWLTNRMRKLNLNFNEEQIRIFIEIVGESKSLLNSQLDKIADYLISKPDAEFEDIKKLINPTRTYTIFDLQDAIGVGNIARALEISFNLLDSNMEIAMLINMMSKYVLTITQTLELMRMNINDREASTKLGVSWFYYINCKKAKFLLNESRLRKAARALYEADLAVKTTQTEPKDIVTQLLAKIIG